MYKKELLITVDQLAGFTSTWDVNCQPVLNNGNYILPLGWEEELIDMDIPFEVKEVEIYIEEII
jgi:hypothetical protein